jgi:DNA (cytosine-5)-methyltransferase 1
MTLNELHLFAGAGGGILGGMLLGHRPVCAVEIEPFRRRVLLQRQRDGLLPWFPIWDDVRTFDGRPWRGKIDVVCGGFPCQDISSSSRTKTGIHGARSGLWKEQARIIGEIRPRYALMENSPMLTVRGLGTVLGDLSEMGYNARWCVLGGRHAGAPTKRDRIWILAYSNQAGVQGQVEGFSPSKVAQPSQELWGVRSKACMCSRLRKWDDAGRPGGDTESPLRRANDGMANWDDQLESIGDGQIPAVVALAWRTLNS